ncbi:MAG: hypothetical protein ACOY9C_12860 [Pseudomonadota bacterium]
MTRRTREVTPVTAFPFTSHVCARTRAYVHKGDAEKPSRVSPASVAALEDALKAALMDGDTDQAHAIREELIAKFAAERGWKRTRSPFTFRALSPLDVPPGEEYPREAVEHPTYFRCGHALAAIVCQPYGGAAVVPAAHDLAVRLGLVVELGGAPPWHLPGQGVPLVYRRPRLGERVGLVVPILGA